MEELLAGDSADSVPRVRGSGPLLRQDTAVQEDPYTVSFATRSALHNDALENGRPHLESALNDGRAIPIPTSSVDPFAEATSEAQTPMNETFLATLAPSVHQRLDLARQMDAVGRAATPVEEEPLSPPDAENNSNTSDEGWQRIDRDRTPAEIEAARRDMEEMMFS